MNPERKKSLQERIVEARESGEKGALEGKPIILEKVQHSHLDVARSFLTAYVEGVDSSLQKFGIQDPSQIGLDELYLHILVEEGFTSGVEGFNDGLRGYAPSSSHQEVSKANNKHYNEGFRIGQTFMLAKAREGNFEGLVSYEHIAEPAKELLVDEIKKWFSNKSIINCNPGLVLYLQPYARLAFAYCINNGESGSEEFFKNLRTRVMNNKSYDNEKKNEVIAGAEKAFNFAMRLRAQS